MNGYRKNYIHVSFDEVTEFIPRIPKFRCTGEDDTIPRICVAESIRNCLRSAPGAGLAVKNLNGAGISFVIHSYLLWPHYGSVKHTGWVKQHVPDAEFSGEIWLTKPPRLVQRRDYEILEPEYATSQDDHQYPIITDCKLKRVKNQNNWELFWNKFRPGEPMPPQFAMPDISYRTLAENLDKMIDAINERTMK